MKKLLFVLSIILIEGAFADSPKGFPNLFYRNNIYSIENFVLDRTCFSMKGPNYGFHCNPAYLADNEKRKLNISALVTDSLSKVVDYSEEADQLDSVGIIRKGLDEKEPILSQAAVSLWYRHDWWEITLTPARIGVASDVRNPALPEMTTFVSLERELQWRFGLVAFDDPRFRVGANLRLVDAKIFDDRFDVLAASVGTQSFEVLEGQTLFLEPSLAYTFDASWDPTITASLTDVAILTIDEGIPTSPLLELAYSTTPDALEKRLSTAIQLTIGEDLGSLRSRVSWAGVYYPTDDWGLSLLLADNRYGIGLEGHIDSLVLGLGYKSEDFDFGGYEKERVDQWLFRAGLIF